jgi:hypothetical protein
MVKINLLRDSVLTACFDEGILKGMIVEFIGEDLFYGTVGNILALYSTSGKIIAPIERKLTAEEYQHVKTAVLEYGKTYAERKITFIEIS